MATRIESPLIIQPVSQPAKMQAAHSTTLSLSAGQLALLQVIIIQLEALQLIQAI